MLKIKAEVLENYIKGKDLNRPEILEKIYSEKSKVIFCIQPSTISFPSEISDSCPYNVKSISDAGDAWAVYHVGTGNTDYGTLNTNAVFVDDATRWNDTDPDSVNFTLGSSGAVNSSSKTYVAYCFGDVNGSSRFSQYTGNIPIRPPVLVSTIDTQLQQIVKQLPQNTNSGYQTLKNGYPKFPHTCEKVTRSLVNKS